MVMRGENDPLITPQKRLKLKKYKSKDSQKLLREKKRLPQWGCAPL